MTWDDLAEQISALLEPWEAGVPQGGEDYRLWCGNYARVRERLPYLPQVHEEQPPTACIDLIVEREADRVTGSTTRAIRWRRRWRISGWSGRPRSMPPPCQVRSRPPGRRC